MMDEREALAKLIADERFYDVSERFYDVSANVCLEIAGIVLAAGYRLPTTGEIAAERRGWEQGRDAAAAVVFSARSSVAAARQIEAAIRALTPPDQMQRGASETPGAPASPRRRDRVGCSSDTYGGRGAR